MQVELDTLHWSGIRPFHANIIYKEPYADIVSDLCHIALETGWLMETAVITTFGKEPSKPFPFGDFAISHTYLGRPLPDMVSIFDDYLKYGGFEFSAFFRPEAGHLVVRSRTENSLKHLALFGHVKYYEHRII